MYRLLFVTILFAVKCKSETAKANETDWSLLCQPPDSEKIVKFNWDFNGVDPSGYYFPIGSEANQNIYNQLFIVSEENAPIQDLINQKNVDNFCLRLQFNSTEALFSGFAVSSTAASSFKCTAIGDDKWIMDCVSDEGFSHKRYVTKTDSRSWAFTYICWEDGQSGWTVFSKAKSLTKEIELEVLEHAKSFGFHTGEIILHIPYDKCAA